MLMNPSIAVINNETTFRWTISRLLEARGYKVATYDRATAAVDDVRGTQPAAVVLEAAYGSAITATSIVERLRSNRSTRHVPIVVCSPDGRFLNSYGEYLRGQGCVVLGRPFNDQQFLELVERSASACVMPADPFVHDTGVHSW